MDTQLTEHQTPSIVSLKLVAGTFFAALGVLMALQNLDLLEAGKFLRYWPVVLIVIGLIKLTRAGDQTVAVISLLAGGFLLACSTHLIRLTIFDLWPLALVVAGLVVVAQAVGWKTTSETGSETSNVWAVLTTRRIAITSADYRGGRLVAFMGGCQLDLTDAGIQQTPVIVEAIAVWGGINIRVPAGWEVVAEVMPIMGGIDVKTKASTGGKQLIVRGLALMGGMNIKSVEARTI